LLRRRDSPLLAAILVLMTATFAGSAVWARVTLGSMSSSFLIAFVATLLLARFFSGSLAAAPFASQAGA
jgi:hypothetical protein